MSILIYVRFLVMTAKFCKTPKVLFETADDAYTAGEIILC